ncbi:MAG: c-type cytochrome [Pseudomonadales bacterium]|nr:cytochrome c [Pseudomonadales bacterium]NIX09292.1 c-type cytochrome [Pseudomonadales bacterium]
MRERLQIVAVLIALGIAGPTHGAHPNLGERATESFVRAVDITVMPDGSGLPAGSGNATKGRSVYLAHCAACHGATGTGGPNNRLVGGRGTLGSSQPIKTVGSYWPYATTLFDYVRRAMPYSVPGILSSDEVYSVTAYILHLNGIVGEDAELNATSLPGVAMPNRDGFTSAVSGASAP